MCNILKQLHITHLKPSCGMHVPNTDLKQLVDVMTITWLIRMHCWSFRRNTRISQFQMPSIRMFFLSHHWPMAFLSSRQCGIRFTCLVQRLRVGPSVYVTLSSRQNAFDVNGFSVDGIIVLSFTVIETPSP